MKSISEQIKAAKPDEIEEILQAVLARYRELYPQWDIGVLSLEKAEDKNRQLDRTIAILEKMKE